MKIVVSNPEDGKTYQKELEKPQEKSLYGKKIYEKINGDSLGMAGYELVLTGGSDKQGFPMRVDLHGSARKKVLLSKGPGYKPKKHGERKRKSVRGNTISEETAQINAKVVKAGKDGFDKLFGKAEKKDEKPKEDKK